MNKKIKILCTFAPFIFTVMPLKEIRCLDRNALLGIWNITESWEELLVQARLSAGEKQQFTLFGNDNRKKHWLAGRLLTRSLLAEEFTLVYDADGKPHIEDPGHFISVSHSKEMAAVIVSKENAVGIDIEQMQPRIEKVIQKFLSPEEIASLTQVNRLEKLYVYWSGKEALYKLNGKGAPAFDEQILIDSFEYCTPGCVRGRIIKSDGIFTYQVNYETMDGYMLAYTTE